MVSTNDYTWKLLVGGMGGVGKTTFLHRYIHDEFIADTKLTVGCQFHSTVVNRHGKQIGLIIWDLGGQQRFRFIQDKYMRGASAGLVMFSCDNFISLLKVERWVELFRENASPSIPIVLVGAKMDLVDNDDDRKEIEINAREIVKTLGLTGYMATSSKWDMNVPETIHRILDILLWQKTNGRLGTASIGST